jgi:predicted site-specific integrase-resolvase
VELVQDVAIDGLGMSQVRARRGIHDATALRWLRKGLWRYAVLAGLGE